MVEPRPDSLRRWWQVAALAAIAIAVLIFVVTREGPAEKQLKKRLALQDELRREQPSITVIAREPATLYFGDEACTSKQYLDALLANAEFRRKLADAGFTKIQCSDGAYEDERVRPLQ